MADKIGFEKRGLEVGLEILGMKNPLVIHHYDCDGITSGALVIAALRKNGVKAKELTIKTGRPVNADCRQAQWRLGFH